jgi:Tfp pilus assembly protein PilO
MSEQTPNWGQIVGSTDEVNAKMQEERVREMIDNHNKQLPMLIELSDLAAKVKKVNYDAFVKAGFSPQDALSLIR